MEKKSQKYDRQLRLWGDHGQSSLENAKVCLVNACAAGTETLKNLILPGVGSFTIVDPAIVSAPDLGNNFFLTADSLGKSRAECTHAYLSALNPSVSGSYLQSSLETVMESGATFFAQFTLVIAVDLRESQLLTLADLLWDIDVALTSIRCYGLVATIRHQIREMFIVETHPEHPVDDLRLDCPFPTLQAYVESVDMSTVDEKTHSHTPYVVVLLKALSKWKGEHDGQVPQTRDDKNAFKQLLHDSQLVTENGVTVMETNFEEAIGAAYKAWSPTRIPSDVQRILDDDQCDALSPSSANYWFLARALRDFVRNEGQGRLPLRGTIPDMTSDSASYITLQRIYFEQAARDTDAVATRVRQLIASVDKPEDSVSDLEIKMLCKNASFLRLVRMRSVRDEMDFMTAKGPDIGAQLEDVGASNMVYYVLLRAIDSFYEEHRRFPGDSDDCVETDVALLRTCTQQLLGRLGLSAGGVMEDHMHEMCRFGAAELHTVASVIGGIASQEACKIITRQWVPVNNTFIYNGINSTTTAIEL